MAENQSTVQKVSVLIQFLTFHTHTLWPMQQQTDRRTDGLIKTGVLGRAGRDSWLKARGWIYLFVFLPRRGFRYGRAFHRLRGGLMLYVGRTWGPCWPRWQQHVDNALQGMAFLYEMMRLTNIYHWLLLPLLRVSPGPGPGGFATEAEFVAVAAARENYWILKLGTERYGYGRLRGGLNSRVEVTAPLPRAPSTMPAGALPQRALSTRSTTAGARTRPLNFAGGTRVSRLARANPAHCPTLRTGCAIIEYRAPFLSPLTSWPLIVPGAAAKARRGRPARRLELDRELWERGR